MKFSPSTHRVLFFVYLLPMCALSYGASYFLNHAIKAFGDSPIKIPFFGIGVLDEWLPLGTTLVFVMSFVPYVFATFVSKNFLWLPIIILIILGGLFFFTEDEMMKEIAIALSVASMFGNNTGMFVQSFKPINSSKL